MDGIESSYKRLYPIVLGKCRRMIDDAEEARDIVQETFSRLWRERERITDERALIAWVYRTSTRLAIDRLRASRRLVRDEPPFSPGHVEATDFTDPEDRAACRRTLARLQHELPSDELEVAILCRLDGLNQVEIGEVLGISERTVRRIMTRLDGRLERLRARDDRMRT